MCNDYRHRGCGFVEFSSPEERSNALKADHIFEGIEFECSGALSKPKRKRREALVNSERRKIRVERLPLYITSSKSTHPTPLIFILSGILKNFFSYYGTVEETAIHRSELVEDNAAFVTFEEKFIADRLVGASLILSKFDKPLKIFYPKTTEEQSTKKSKPDLYENPDNYRMNYSSSVFRAKRVGGFSILEKVPKKVWAEVE
jgi:RNA recognition motif-containing protein